MARSSLLIATSLLFGIICTIAALPTRHVRQAALRSRVKLMQKTSIGTRVARLQSVFTGQCISIQNTNVPTTIQLGESQTGSFQLVTYSTSCSASTYEQISEATLEASSVVNERHPMCSFKLGHNTLPESPAKVTFHQDRSKNSIKYEADVHDNRECINICSTSEWTKYAAFVRIQVNNQPVDNYIQLFSDSNCTAQTPQATEVHDDANLVDITRKSSSSVVSFTLYQA